MKRFSPLLVAPHFFLFFTFEMSVVGTSNMFQVFTSIGTAKASYVCVTCVSSEPQKWARALA